jgi:chromate reductase, NAD(P)H dehydrogenase (quinone)
VPRLPQHAGDAAAGSYVGGLDKLFDANGKLANEGTQKFLQGFLQSFAA